MAYWICLLCDCGDLCLMNVGVVKLFFCCVLCAGFDCAGFMRVIGLGFDDMGGC